MERLLPPVHAAEVYRPIHLEFIALDSSAAIV